MAKSVASAGALLDQLQQASSKADRMKVGDFLDIVGRRSHGPWLLLPALIGMTPIGGIPGVPTLLAVIIVLIAVQIAWGSDHLWLPNFVERHEIDTGKVAKTARGMEPIGKFLDSVFRGWLSFLVSPPFERAGALMTLALCATVPPLELLPFAVIASFGAIALFGLALIIKDGSLMLLSTAASAAAILVVGDLLL